MSVERKLLRIEGDIRSVEDQILAIANDREDQLQALRAEKAALRAKEAALRAEKAALRAEKAAFLAKEADLRAEKAVIRTDMGVPAAGKLYLLIFSLTDATTARVMIHPLLCRDHIRASQRLLD